MNTSAALNIWVFFCRKNELMFKRESIKRLQVFLTSTVLVIQLENQSIMVNSFHTAFPFAPRSLLIMVMQHMQLHVSHAANKITTPIAFST